MGLYRPDWNKLEDFGTWESNVRVVFINNDTVVLSGNKQYNRNTSLGETVFGEHTAFQAGESFGEQNKSERFACAIRFLSNCKDS